MNPIEENRCKSVVEKLEKMCYEEIPDFSFSAYEFDSKESKGYDVVLRQINADCKTGLVYSIVLSDEDVFAWPCRHDPQLLGTPLLGSKSIERMYEAHTTMLDILARIAEEHDNLDSEVDEDYFKLIA